MASAAMATTASRTLPPASPSCSRTRFSVVSYSALVFPRARCPRIHLLVSIPQQGSRHLCPWSGLKHLGISCRYRNRGGKERYMGRVYASLFGVGAPEALVIGVVALLVFGPKGLAEVARNLGKTLRAFQPTIKELQEVSREFKNTLEREIGLDEAPFSTTNSASQSSPSANGNPQDIVDPNGIPSTRRSLSGEELAKLARGQLSVANTASQAQATELEGQPQGVPDALSSPETADSPTSQAAGPTPASEVVAQTTVAENPESEGSKS